MVMDDKIALLTQQLYDDGIKKAQIEGEKLLAIAQADAKQIVAQALKDAEDIIRQAKSTAEDMQKNTAAEIKTSSNQALLLVKQTITDMLTLRLANQIVDETFKHNEVKLKILLYAAESMINSHKGHTINIDLPIDISKDVYDWLESSIHKQLHDKVKFQLSHKIDSGFRISPQNKNYAISFTDDDFQKFFMQLIRPVTSEILFGNV
jgi:V/A-type H+-transporting ATPase subunit E